MVREPELDPAALAELYRAKAFAEEDVADSLLPGVRSRGGEADAPLLLVKGEPGPHTSDQPVGRDELDAALAALAALGVDTARFLAVSSRPERETAPGEAVAARLALYLEAADPGLVVALDAPAAADLAAAAGLAALPFGEPTVVRGRTLLAVDGLGAALSDDARKRRVWGQFKALATQKGRPARAPFGDPSS